MKNPYNWTRTRPLIEIPRPEVPELAAGLREGRSYILLAGRGMGKSVFLHQIRRELEGDEDLRAFLIPDPPVTLTARACLEKLGHVLGVDTERMGLNGKGVSDLIDAYLKKDVPANVVLLFDEFDRYARLPTSEDSGTPGRDFFNNVETMRRSPPGSGAVGVLAAGSLGSFIFRDALGSPFADRASRVLISPFGREQIESLARPFADRGKALAEGVVESLELASGGNPALVTFGLESLWRREAPTERDVTAAFSRFLDDNADFVRSFHISFANPRLSEAPRRVWDLIRKSSGEVSHEELEKACGPPDQLLYLDFKDVLILLKAAGLVRITGTVRSDPVVVEPITSILNLPNVASRQSDLRARLADDLVQILSWMHVGAADFFRPGSEGLGKRLVPEAVFAAFLALGLELLGWQADRESQRGAGRTDVLLRRPGKPDVAIVEVKMWGRKDYREVQRQIESYWTAATAAGAVVMLTDARIEDWPVTYQQACVADHDVRHESVDSPIRVLKVSSRTADGVPVEVDHFLLRLPRGR